MEFTTNNPKRPESATNETAARSPETLTPVDKLKQLLTVSDEVIAEQQPRFRAAVEGVTCKLANPDQRRAAEIYARVIEWDLFGKPRDPLPEGLVVSGPAHDKLLLDTRIPYLHNEITVLERPFQDAGIKSVRWAVRDSLRERKAEIKTVLEEYIGDSPELHLIASFDTPQRKPEDIPLSQYWRLVRETQIKNEAGAADWSSSDEVLLRTTEQGLMIQRRTQALDDETMPGAANTKGDGALDRARAYFIPLIAEHFERTHHTPFGSIHKPEEDLKSGPGNNLYIYTQGESQSIRLDTVVIAVAERLTETLAIGPSGMHTATSTFLTEVMQKILDPETTWSLETIIATSQKECLDFLVREYTDYINNINYPSRFTLNSPPDLKLFSHDPSVPVDYQPLDQDEEKDMRETFTWKGMFLNESEVLNAEVLAKIHGARNDEQPTSNPRVAEVTTSDPRAGEVTMNNPKVGKLPTSSPRVGEIPTGDPRVGKVTKYEPAEYRTLSRLIQPRGRTEGLPATAEAEDLVINYRGAYLARAEPFVPGYILVSASPGHDRFGFVVDPKGDPYTPCEVTIEDGGRAALAEAYQSLGLHELATIASTTSNLTVSELVKAIVNSSTYYIPEVGGNSGGYAQPISEKFHTRKLQDFDRHVNKTEGKLYVQCTGAAEFVQYSLEMAFGQGCAATIGGLALRNYDSTILALPHAQTAFNWQGKLYMLDGTPLRPEAGTTSSLPPATSSSSEQRKPPEIKMPNSAAPTEPKQTAPRPEKSQIERTTDLYTSLTERMRAAFDLPDGEAVRTYIVGLPEQDPARRTLESVFQYGRGVANPDDVRRACKYIKACARSNITQRTSMGFGHYSPSFLRQLSSTMVTLESIASANSE